MVTFDTTQRWVLDIAYPILKANGLTAAVFVTPEQIGKNGYLDWQELAKMAAEGFDIGAAGHIQTSTAPYENGDAFEKPLEDELSAGRKNIPGAPATALWLLHICRRKSQRQRHRPFEKAWLPGCLYTAGGTKSFLHG